MKGIGIVMVALMVLIITILIIAIVMIQTSRMTETMVNASERGICQIFPSLCPS